MEGPARRRASPALAALAVNPPGTSASDPQASKRALREWMLPRLRALSREEREEGSARLRGRLGTSMGFREARRILAFIPLPSEPDLMPLLIDHREAGGVVLLPRWHAGSEEYLPAVFPPGGALVAGPHGVQEPTASAPWAGDEPLDLVLVPGLAFDRQGCRLGRGRGFYDRLLSRLAAGNRWGVGFDLQVVAEVPREPHDVNLDLVATPGIWHPVNPEPRRS